MRSSAQIGVISAFPILPRRREQVDGNTVLQRHGAVGQMGRNSQHFTWFQDLFHTIEDELQGAFFHHGDLLIMMAVFRYGASLLEINTRDCHRVAMNDLARECRTQLLFFDSTPFVDLHGGIDSSTAAGIQIV